MPETLFFYPDYRQTNDYQSLLYSTASIDRNILAGTLDDAIALAGANPDQSVIFHLHWPEPLFAGIADKSSFHLRIDDVISSIRLLQSLNGRFFWTIHNKLPHDQTFQEEYIELHSKLAKDADMVFVHSESAKKVVNQVYSLPKGRTVVLPHGTYSGIYPVLFDKTTARDRLGIRQDVVVFGFIGQLRPYKGLHSLIEAFREFRRLDGNAVLLIAGKPAFPTKSGEWSAMQTLVSGLMVEERFIPTEELSLYFGAADFIVLPYTDILTSGSAMLATSFGKPLILPRLPSLTEFENSGVSLTYKPSDPAGLYNTMSLAAAMSESERIAMEKSSTEFGILNSWRVVAPLFNTVISQRGIVSTETLMTTSGECRARIPEDCPSGGLGVCVVDYHTTDDTIALVNGIEDIASRTPYCVYVLDNSGDPRTFARLCRLLPNAVIATTGSNLGYAAGNNVLVQLLRAHNRKLVLILNPDMRLGHGAIDKMADFLAVNSQTVVSPLVLKEDGSTSFAGAFFTEGLDLEVHHYLDGQKPSKAGLEPYAVDALNGCSLMFSVATYDKVGPIPEQYFLYYEDTDWFKRAGQSKVLLWIVPEAHAYHLKKSHGSVVPSMYYIYYFVRGNSLFATEFDRNVEGAQQRLRASFVSGWRERIQQVAPSYLPIYELLVASGFEDGAMSISGPISLGKRIDRAAGSISHVIGFVEELRDNNKTYIGWVAAPVSHDSSGIGVWLIIDDTPVLYAEATIERPDVAAAGYASRSGFCVTIPDSYQTGRSLVVEIRSAVAGMRLPFAGQEQELQFHTRVVPDRTQNRTPVYEGRVEGISEGKLSGWVWDKANPMQSVYAKARVDGELLVLGSANVYRSDLEKAGKGTGRHSFSVVMPKSILTLPNFDIELFANNEATAIFKTRVSYKQPQHLFSKKFDLNDFLRWSYIEERMPVGGYDEADLLRHQLDSTYQTLAARAATRSTAPLVSIIMPVFNRASVVSRAIKSVLHQTYPNWELIIIDDGSSDGSVDEVGSLLEQLKDDRCLFLQHENNKGVSAARNTGLKACAGDLICYLDSDNLWKADAVSILAYELISDNAALAAYAGQEIWERIEATNQLELRSIRVAPFNRSKLEHRNFIDLNVFMHRRECLDRYGQFREDMRRLVDWDLILRYTSEVQPKFVPALLSEYFVNGVKNQITQTENYRSALGGIRETLVTLSSRSDRSDALAPSDIAVLLSSASSDELSIWCSLSADWLLQDRVSLYSLTMSGTGNFVSRVLNVQDIISDGATPIHGAEISLNSFGRDLGMRSELLVVDAIHVVQKGWRHVILKAQEHAILAVTGRSVPFRSSGHIVDMNPQLDKLPRLISDSVLRWEISTDLLGQETATLPSGWMWIAPRLALNMTNSLGLSSSVAEATQTFFSARMVYREMRSGYLPDIIVMEREPLLTP